jgi:glycine/D-amino acid oxidase-like deaminating enzyme
MSVDLSRRTMLGAAIGAAAAPAVRAATRAPAILKGLPDMLVVGAGAFGGWTALRLREQGARVTLVDAYGPGNNRASSGGESRNLRTTYGDREIYSRWAEKAWGAWGRRQEEFGRRLVFPSGAFTILSAERMAAQKAAFDRLSLPYEILDAADARRRWPQVTFADDERLFFEPRAGGVKARESMIAVSEAFEKKGGTIRIGKADPAASPAAGGKLDALAVNGEKLSAGGYLFACGPWLPKLLPGLLRDKIVVPRVELYFVGSAPGDLRYRWEKLPNITELGLYTTSDIGDGFKVRLAQPSVSIDPDSGDRFPTYFMEPDVRAYVARRLPGLVGQPIVATYVCQVEHSDNDHFIIDRHPEMENVWVAGGGSGHAFKMGPVLGDYLADRMLGRPAPAEQALFSLSAHGRVKETLA